MKQQWRLVLAVTVTYWFSTRYRYHIWPCSPCIFVQELATCIISSAPSRINNAQTYYFVKGPGFVYVIIIKSCFFLSPTFAGESCGYVPRDSECLQTGITYCHCQSQNNLIV